MKGSAGMMSMKDFWRVMAATAEPSGVQAVQEIADTPFVDLGFDSLTLIDAVERIESQYGIGIDHRRLEGLKTPRALYSFLSDRGGRTATPSRPPVGLGRVTISQQDPSSSTEPHE
ncbi:acyl carrier protein [Streptomyces sp. NBC_01077]|uniref:acyl carrier protein n=1 Tax=Streptomyces sp. NBC_01077 TaxID=2903746 RepID=UPI00386DDDF6|nr:acyl carrier protein [Streptomyces sp. NBC_01077]WSV43604.1 acyl carrier protein [Streptomyces sp. NBC_01077]